jgi:hypothetical protein
VSHCAEVQELRRYLPLYHRLSAHVGVFRVALASGSPPPAGVAALLDKIQIKEAVWISWEPRQGTMYFRLITFVHEKFKILGFNYE